MWKVKLVGGLLALFIIGTMIFLVLDPGGDIYNQYLSLGNSSKSGFESKKEFNYQSEIRDNQNKQQQGITNNTELREVVYFNQAKAGMTSEFGGWEGNNLVDVGKSAPYSIKDSGCGPTSAAEFEAQQGSHSDLANPENMTKFWADNGLIVFGSVSGGRITGPGATDAIKRYAEIQGYKYDVLPQEAWNDEAKAKEWWNNHLSNNHWVIDLLGQSQGSRGTPIEWTNNGHFVSFYGLDGDKPITWDVGKTARAGKGYDFHTIWNDSRPISNDTNKYWNTAIWNESAGSGSSGSGSNPGKQEAADGVIKLTSNMKFADRTYGYTKGQVADMECYSFKTTAANKKNFTVFVDPGHGKGEYTEKVGEFIFPTDDYIKKVVGGKEQDGSSDVGKAVEDRGEETDFALAVGLKLKDLLLADGYDVIMSRTSNTRKVSNGGVGILANQYADIFVAIHWNASGDGSGAARGTETFYYDDSAPSSIGYTYSGMASKWGKTSSSIQKSKSLATELTNNITSQVGFPKHGTGISAQYERVLGYTTIPAVLVETGFGDNATDKALLSKHDEIAKAYLDGINSYYNSNK